MLCNRDTSASAISHTSAGFFFVEKKGGASDSESWTHEIHSEISISLTSGPCYIQVATFGSDIYKVRPAQCI